MKRWKVTLEYNGAGFCGWQRQAHALSVQQVLEEALFKFSGERVETFVAGRTDSGVHALGQVVHVDLEKETTAHIIQSALNFHVRPHLLSVVDAEEAPAAFHARFDAKKRRYRYVIVNRRAPLAIEATTAWHVHRPLLLEPMRDAARVLIGKHDFSTFRASHCQSNSPLRTLDLLDIAQQGDHFFFDVEARSFLYHQVRNMVGTLVKVGCGDWSVADFADAFAACDRRKGGPTAPPEGLFFVKVTYDGF